MLRGSRWTGWRFTAAVHALAAAAAGASIGALLGEVGSLVRQDVRAGSASVLALLAIAAGAAEIRGRRLALLQRSRETPQQWVGGGPVGWALRNGLALGSGFWTRIGFWAWYAVPAACVISGSPLVGAATYGAYGAARGLASYALFSSLVRSGNDHVGDRLHAWNPGARLGAAFLLLVAGVATAVAVGA